MLRECGAARIQTPHASKNSSVEGLLSASSPLKSPSRSQLRSPVSGSCPTPRSLRVTTIAQESSSVDSVVSQMERVANCMDGGYNAQSHAAHTATLSLNERLAMANVVSVTSAEKKQFSAKVTKAAMLEYTPKSLKIAASSSGYSGDTHAVGPVRPRKGSAYPRPVARARATRPISQPK